MCMTGRPPGQVWEALLPNALSNNICPNQPECAKGQRNIINSFQSE